MKGNHPELDTSSFLNDDNILVYQSLIRPMQWSITLGQLFDIQCTVSRFRALPQEGHLDCVKRIYVYLLKFKDFMICFHGKEPEYDDVEIK